MIEWMDVQDVERQLIELKSSSVWVTKFAELQNQFESIVEQNGAFILHCWAAAPAMFGSLKNIALALLSVFGSTYLCERCFRL
uniref:General transcription factor III repeat domaincontaining protein 2Alike [Pelodiscus sinensis] n=1 Tax=Lepeophtheirus salmonis TaxID=72036 RepID=A0A0K2VL35_LEPSM